MPAPDFSSEIVSVAFTGDVLIDALIGRRGKWADSEITYSFPGHGSFWSTDPDTGYGPSSNSESEPWSGSFSPISDSDQVYFIEALSQWGNVANLQFVNVEDTETNVGDIRVAYTYLDDKDHAEAWAYLPVATAAVAGDIWINSESLSAIDFWVPGTYSFNTIVHEIGHALGLTHPFGNLQFPVEWDTQSYSIMSYSAIAGDQNSEFSFYPTTPMLLDILALQYLYDPSTKQNGDDSYFYNDSETYHETVWDSGGTGDRIIYNGSQNSTIDLREGMGSYIGNSVYAEDFFTVTRVPNIWIAYNTMIEDAVGGSGDDFLQGNDADNFLDGNLGNDTAIFTGLFSQAHFAYASNTDTFLITTPSGGTDRVTNIEFFKFDDETVSQQEIIDRIDDVLPVLTVENITVSEGPGLKAATFVIQASASAAEAITGNFELVSGTATVGSDFRANSGIFTIPAGANSTTVDVTILDDAVVESTETFQLRLSNVTHAELSGGGSTLTATGQITDTDKPSNGGGDTPADSDIEIVQRGVVAKAAGDDIYVISSATVDPNARISISDAQGANKIQLIGGSNIQSSIVASNTAMLTLSNGAEIVILGAASFMYETGGNPLTATSGVINNYADFVSEILGTSIPAPSGAPNAGGAVLIEPDGSTSAAAFTTVSEPYQLVEAGEIGLMQGDLSIITQL